MTPAESLVVVQRRFLDVLAERDEARVQLGEAQRLLRLALSSHDSSRVIVKAFVDEDRGGDYLVADAPWATEARAFLGGNHADR